MKNIGYVLVHKFLNSSLIHGNFFTIKIYVGGLTFDPAVKSPLRKLASYTTMPGVGSKFSDCNSVYCFYTRGEAVDNGSSTWVFASHIRAAEWLILGSTWLSPGCCDLGAKTRICKISVYLSLCFIDIKQPNQLYFCLVIYYMNIYKSFNRDMQH